jgi:hypothetical protein
MRWPWKHSSAAGWLDANGHSEQATTGGTSAVNPLSDPCDHQNRIAQCIAALGDSFLLLDNY